MNGYWTEVALGDVAAIVRESVNPADIPDGTLYVGLENIERGGMFRNVGTVENGELASSKFAFDASKILYGKLRPNLGKVACPTFEGVCSTDILPIAPGPRIDRDYLAHFLAQPEVVALAARHASGVNLPRLSARELKRFRVPLPPLDEQGRIVRVLDAADHVRAKRASSIDVIDQLRNALFLAMTARADTPWRVVKVADLADKSRGGIRTGPFGSQLLHSEFVDEGIAVLGIDNAVMNEFRASAQRYITASKYRELRRYTVNPGDVLITIMGTCGRVAVVPDDIGVAINTKHLCCITLDQSRCLPQFLHAYFLSHPTARRYLRSRAKGAIMSGLNMGIIKELPVHLPPMSAQRELADRLAEIARMHDHAVAHASRLDRLRDTLQHRAFNGEL